MRPTDSALERATRLRRRELSRSWPTWSRACRCSPGSRDGLPIGVQLVGRPGADRLLLALAEQLTR